MLRWHYLPDAIRARTLEASGVWTESSLFAERVRRSNFVTKAFAKVQLNLPKIATASTSDNEWTRLSTALQER